VVKLHLRHPLHAKLYLLFRHDPVSPSIAKLGEAGTEPLPESRNESIPHARRVHQIIRARSSFKAV